MDDRSDDDILDISFSDEDETGQDRPDVIDITLEPEGPSAAALTPPPRRQPSAPPQTDEADDDLPMTAGGACPRCGFALRPLERQCPRCARLGDVAMPVPPPPAAAGSAAQDTAPSEVQTFPGARRSGCLTAGIISGIVLIIAAGVFTAVWLGPAQRAKREYHLGVQAQARADYERAREHYRNALDLDPRMGLAAFSMGTTYLLLGDPAMLEGIRKLTDRAVQGDTADLNMADYWFRRALAIGERLPPKVRLLDRRIQTPSKLRAFARASLALTAFLRAAAALDAEAFEDAEAWLQVALREAQAAVVDDPGNVAADYIIQAVAPTLKPPTTIP